MTGQTKSVVVFRSGRQSGIWWVRGHEVTVDPETGTIVAVGPVEGWGDRELLQEALEMEGEAPQIGDPAPKGWELWRS